MTDSRNYDLEELYQDRKRASTQAEKRRIDKTIFRIMKESGATRQRREQLVQAIRNDDRRAIKRFQHDLMVMNAKQTYGHRI